jgi:hypothetical protein
VACAAGPSRALGTMTVHMGRQLGRAHMHTKSALTVTISEQLPALQQLRHLQPHCGREDGRSTSAHALGARLHKAMQVASSSALPAVQQHCDCLVWRALRWRGAYLEISPAEEESVDKNSDEEQQQAEEDCGNASHDTNAPLVFTSSAVGAAGTHEL